MSYFPYREYDFGHNDKLGIVLAPAGGYANHVRLLCFLSNQLSAYMFPKLKLYKLKHKINFIKSHIYFQERSWHNWLATEWKYRQQFDKSEIAVSHNLNLLNTNYKQTNKFLGVFVDSETCYKSYLKFNSNLDSTTKENFLEYCNNWFDKCKILSEKHNKLKILDCNILQNPILDKNLYDEIINWFEIDNQYDSACEIHNIWYQLHRKAEKEFVEDITKLYS